jgi:hypothetical protein
MSFNSPSANEQIHAVRANTVKTEGYASMSPSRTTPNTISAIDKGVHSFKRRIQNQVLSEAGLKTVESRIVSHVQEFVDYLGSHLDAGQPCLVQDDAGWGPQRNISDACNFMTYNVISDLCYGESLDLFRSSEMRWFPHAVAVISRRVVVVSLEVLIMSQDNIVCLRICRREYCSQDSTTTSWTDCYLPSNDRRYSN